VRTELFDYQLPQELIATRPPELRDGGRLCVVERSGIRHAQVADLVDELRAGDLVVLNTTRVRRARLACTRPRVGASGGARVELLFLHQDSQGRWAALGKANRPLRVGDHLEALGLTLFISAREEGGILWITTDGDIEAILAQAGTMPIPPYLERDADEADLGRYQTVFAEQLGSAAAPTAGLHLTTAMLQAMEERGVELAHVVLHVGLGTFRPVVVADLDDHPMHREWIEVDTRVVHQVDATRERGGRVVAIGTTAVRALEASWDSERPGRVKATEKSTDLLIQPGYEFRVVDALLTNFHQPRSTLLALVSAFVGLEATRAAYAQALEKRYRFLSYGDAMWIPARGEAR
jgi:S-adenosylmethionine:tRNA ribosyltransferase-isomerase